MKEYIEREAVLKEIESAVGMGGLVSGALRRYVKRVPAADVVERKRGEWILRHVGHGHYWECSECHKNPCIYVTKDTNFCPNCGADMREVDHEMP